MAELSATFAAALAQYRQALADHNAYYDAHVAPADKACQAAQEAAGVIYDATAPNDARKAAFAVYDAAQTYFDGLVDMTNDAAEKLLRTPIRSIAELAVKIDVAAEQELFTQHTQGTSFVEVIRADAHALAGE